MRRAALVMLSFLVLMDVRNTQQMSRNMELGCTPFTVWENEHRQPRYWILHCPDEAWGKAQGEGMWVP